jgi:superfamily II DNA/RNA helicase
LHTFAELGVPQKVADVLAHRGVTTPFPIQAATIADALAGRDLCGRAPTGSGKTLAFSIPLAVKAGRGAPGRPRALVLVPTRELAAQVSSELRPLAETRGRRVATFYGGVPISRDQRRLRAGVDLLVACPGRLADLVQRGNADLRDVDLVVVDEADRMADMGFLPEVRRLLDATSAGRQTLLFSATLDGDVDVLVRRYQRDPVRHELDAPEESRGDVRHLFWETDPSARVGIAADVVRATAPAIVFTRTRHGADRVARQLQRDGVTAAAIHGARSQGQRDRALADFTGGRVAALVATDVAARGIHVDDVGVVVHFDLPATDKDYVHRSGRTGRAGSTGLVVTLVPPDRLRDAADLQRALSLPAGVHAVTLAQLTDPAASAAPARVERRAPQPARPAHRRTEPGRRRGGPPARGRGHRGDTQPARTRRGA